VGGRGSQHLAIVPQRVVVEAAKHNIEHPETNRKKSTSVVVNNVEVFSLRGVVRRSEEEPLDRLRNRKNKHDDTNYPCEACMK
jgi:hypothetical protein